MRLFTSLALLLALAVSASAQTRAAYDQGVEAYRDGRFADAVRSLARATEVSPDDPEVHYLLARVLFDERNPDRDVGRAGSVLNEAIDLDPENVVYLVARLEQLRGDTWNLLQELYRLRLRREVANRLLAIDSTNAYAHEELGAQAIVDYYQYRNAIKFPALQFRSTGVGIQEQPDEVQGPGESSAGQAAVAGIETESAGIEGDIGTSFAGEFGEEISDRFDVREFAPSRRRRHRLRASGAGLVRPGHVPLAPRHRRGPAAAGGLRPHASPRGALRPLRRGTPGRGRDVRPVS